MSSHPFRDDVNPVRSPPAPGLDTVLWSGISSSSGAELLDALLDDPFRRDALSLAEQSAGIGVWSIDLTTGLLRATPQFFRLMGLEPCRDWIPIDSIRALRHPDDRDRVVAGFKRALEGGTDTYEIEYRIVRPNGELRWIFGRGRVVRDADGNPLRYSGVDLDITERKVAERALAAAKEELERMNQVLEQRVRERTAELRAEAERRAEAESRLHQAQKMEAVGQLTGGIAHDFNNILQVIVGNLEIASLVLERDGLGPDSRTGVERAIQTARRATRSAKQLVHRLLAFSRLQRLDPTPLDANALVEEMADMIARTLGETIHVETRLSPGLWLTLVDRNQLETALLNLVVNARDAMPDGGRLVIETANVDLGDDEDVEEDLAPGRYVKLSVRDTGCGIPSELVHRVFEPFFTTKDTGRGSGLGLSMVYGFVQQSGGQVRLRSDVATGTCVQIWLPRTSVAPRATQPAAAPAASAVVEALPRAQNGETVLLVEDNEDVRRFGTAALEELGYGVLQANDGPSALALFEQAGTRIDLLFSDVVLPGGLTGPALAATMRAKRPSLPVVFASGYTGSALPPGQALDRDVLFLSKPYTIESLAKISRFAIDFARRAAADPGSTH